jgi:2-oxo-4-hydroxy-4-carboxy-5-ureidoimidazoline decarboxylase
MMKLETLNQMSDGEFTDVLGSIYEHSPWVAEAVAVKRPFASVDELADAMKEVINQSDDDTRITLLRAHPEFAGKAAMSGELTDASTREQGSLSLNNLPSDQHKRMQEINRRFMQKFGFPGIVAVRMQKSVDGIFALLEQRLQNSPEQEVPAAIAQVHLIAGCRLQDLIEG